MALAQRQPETVMSDTKKQPIIRPGQRKPYVKGTRQQIDERIAFVAGLLRAGATKTEIHRAIREKFNVAWRQADRYVARVRACAEIALSFPAKSPVKHFASSTAND
jgi:hypothetical protein